MNGQYSLTRDNPSSSVSSVTAPSGYPASGSADTSSRIMAQWLSDRLR